jgi:hypothetical protein
MSCGRIINGTRYIHIVNNNELKKKSLNDYVYFNLRDIFENAYDYDTIIYANRFCEKLTGELYFEDDKKSTYNYTNALNEKDYLKKLICWLVDIDINSFEFIILGENEKINMKEYIEWDIWWFQFEELKFLLKQQYNKYGIS